MPQHDEAEDESLLCHRWVPGETCPAALSLPVALTAAEVITSLPRLSNLVSYQEAESQSDTPAPVAL